MGDFVARKLIDKATGLPLTDKLVYIRPAEAIGSGSDIALPETPAHSAFYLTASEVPHGTYTVIVGATPTLDTIVVEPGRVRYKSFTNTIDTCLLDRITSAKVVASAFAADTDATVPYAAFASAVQYAAASKKTLLLDYDLAYDGTYVIVITSNIDIDLCGHEVDFRNVEFNATNGAIVTVRNGYLKVSNAKALSQGQLTYINVQFTDLMFMRASQYDKYIGCTGIQSHAGTDYTNTPLIISPNVATALSLRLTDPGSQSGYQRLTNLQSFIDNHMAQAVIDAGDGGWVETNKTVLNEWIAIPASQRTRIENLVFDVSVESGYTFNAATVQSQNSSLVKQGVCEGIEARIDSNSKEIAEVRGVVSAANTGTGNTAFIATRTVYTTGLDTDVGLGEDVYSYLQNVYGTPSPVVASVYIFNATTGAYTPVPMSTNISIISQAFGGGHYEVKVTGTALANVPSGATLVIEFRSFKSYLFTRPTFRGIV